MLNWKEFAINFIAVSFFLSLTFPDAPGVYAPGHCTPCNQLSAYTKKAMLEYQKLRQVHVVTAQEVGCMCCAFLANTTFHMMPQLLQLERPYNAMVVHPICSNPQRRISHSRLIYSSRGQTFEIDNAADYDFAFAILNNFICT